MTNFRTSLSSYMSGFISAISVAVAVLAGSAIAQGEVAAGQKTADHAPRSLLQSPKSAEGQAPGSVELPSVPGRDGTVTSSDLDAVGMEIFGVLEPADGGLGYGMWRGSSRRTIVSLMASLPDRQGAGVRQDLFARLLLSRAFDPASADRFGAGARGRLVADEVPFMSVRASKLLAAGYLREAERALDQADAPQDDPMDDLGTLHIRSEIFLLTGRTRAACAIAARTRGASAEPYWARLRALCYIVAEDRGAARLSADLLAETGYQDPLFFAALANQIDGAGLSYGDLSIKDGVHFALLSRNDQDGFPRDVLNTDAPAVRAAALRLAQVMARGQEDLVTIQIPLAEAGVLAGSPRGAADVERLRTFYASVVMSEAEIVGLANSQVSPDRSGKASAKKAAAIYQALSAAVMPGDHADVLKLAWDDAAARDRPALFVALYAAALGSLPIETALDMYAADFARASLVVGDYARAARWLALAENVPERSERPGRSGFRGGPDGNSLPALQAALQIVAPDIKRGVGTTEPRWDAADRLVQAQAPGQRRRALHEVRLYQALGGQLNAAARQALAGFPVEVPGVTEGAMPQTGILSGLDAAARAGRKGETVLLVLLALASPQSDSKSAQIPIIVTARCVSALVRTGFIAEAKTLAIESLLADL